MKENRAFENMRMTALERLAEEILKKYKKIPGLSLCRRPRNSV